MRLMSNRKVIKCRKIAKGHASGYALVTSQPLSFLGGVNPKQGKVIDPHHELFNHSIKDKILLIPYETLMYFHKDKTI